MAPSKRDRSSSRIQIYEDPATAAPDRDVQTEMQAIENTHFPNHVESQQHGDRAGEHTTEGRTSSNRAAGERLREGYIRLVRVLPGKLHSLIHCETRIVPVSTNNEYIAVSYAWGPPIAEHAIMLDGHKHMLPDNMWQFLKVWRLRLDQEGQDQQGRGHVTREMALRAPDFVSQASWHLWEACTDWLWIDALCIDQTNMQERMYQVRIMSKIFGGADEVLVWLGPANKAVDDLIKWSFWTSWTGGAPSPIQDRMAGLQDLCERSYWGRLWVFQELRSATKIALMCGSYTFPWTEFEKTFSEAMNVGENFSYSQRTKTELAQLKEVE